MTSQSSAPNINLWDYGFQHGLPFPDVIQRMERTVQHNPPNPLSEKEKRYLDYTRLNLQRIRKWQKIYQPSDEARRVFRAIPGELLFLVISEDWCGDAAQVLPCLQKLVSENPRLHLRLLDRDSHPNIMDLFLTNGKRSIPVIIGVRPEGTVVFRWGARPHPAETLYQEARSQQLPQQDVLHRLHAWYARDRCQTTEQEWVQLLQHLTVT